jgi:hypothetical protein
MSRYFLKLPNCNKFISVCRSIDLKKCFNINKRTDTKVKNCIALYTKDNSFCIVLDSDDEANEWLNSLLEVQNGGVTIPGEVPKPTFGKNNSNLFWNLVCSLKILICRICVGGSDAGKRFGGPVRNTRAI